jgi:hypothetical protein
MLDSNYDNTLFNKNVDFENMDIIEADNPSTEAGKFNFNSY